MSHLSTADILTEDTWRVKVYHLTANGTWEDKGLGKLTYENPMTNVRTRTGTTERITSIIPFHLCVQQEETNQNLLDVYIGAEDSFSRFRNSLTLELKDEEVAISFLSSRACTLIQKLLLESHVRGTAISDTPPLDDTNTTKATTTIFVPKDIQHSSDFPSTISMEEEYDENILSNTTPFSMYSSTNTMETKKDEIMNKQEENSNTIIEEVMNKNMNDATYSPFPSSSKHSITETENNLDDTTFETTLQSHNIVKKENETAAINGTKINIHSSFKQRENNNHNTESDDLLDDLAELADAEDINLLDDDFNIRTPTTTTFMQTDEEPQVEYLQSKSTIDSSINNELTHTITTSSVENSFFENQMGEINNIRNDLDVLRRFAKRFLDIQTYKDLKEKLMLDTRTRDVMQTGSDLITLQENVIDTVENSHLPTTTTGLLPSEEFSNDLASSLSDVSLEVPDTNELLTVLERIFTLVETENKTSNMTSNLYGNGAGIFGLRNNRIDDDHAISDTLIDILLENDEGFLNGLRLAFIEAEKEKKNQLLLRFGILIQKFLFLQNDSLLLSLCDEKMFIEFTLGCFEYSNLHISNFRDLIRDWIHFHTLPCLTLSCEIQNGITTLFKLSFLRDCVLSKHTSETILLFLSKHITRLQHMIFEAAIDGGWVQNLIIGLKSEISIEYNAAWQARLLHGLVPSSITNTIGEVYTTANTNVPPLLLSTSCETCGTIWRSIYPDDINKTYLKYTSTINKNTVNTVPTTTTMSIGGLGGDTPSNSSMVSIPPFLSMRERILLCIQELISIAKQLNEYERFIMQFISPGNNNNGFTTSTTNNMLNTFGGFGNGSYTTPRFSSGTSIGAYTSTTINALQTVLTDRMATVREVSICLNILLSISEYDIAGLRSFILSRKNNIPPIPTSSTAKNLHTNKPNSMIYDGLKADVPMDAESFSIPNYTLADDGRSIRLFEKLHALGASMCNPISPLSTITTTVVNHSTFDSIFNERYKAFGEHGTLVYRVDKSSTLIHTLIWRIVDDPDQFICATAADILRTLNMADTFVNSQERDAFLTLFYDSFMCWLGIPFTCANIPSLPNPDPVAAMGEITSTIRSMVDVEVHKHTLPSFINSRTLLTSELKKRILMFLHPKNSTVPTTISTYMSTQSSNSSINSDTSDNERKSSISGSSPDHLSSQQTNNGPFSDQYIPSLPPSVPNLADATTIGNESFISKNSKIIILDLISSFLTKHQFRIKYYLVQSGFLAKVLRLTRYADGYSVLSAIRFLKMLIVCKDEFYTRLLISKNLFADVFAAYIRFHTRGNHNNLVTSAIIDLIATVVSTDINVLIDHIATTYTPLLLLDATTIMSNNTLSLNNGLHPFISLLEAARINWKEERYYRLLNIPLPLNGLRNIANITTNNNTSLSNTIPSKTNVTFTAGNKISTDIFEFVDETLDPPISVSYIASSSGNEQIQTEQKQSPLKTVEKRSRDSFNENIRGMTESVTSSDSEDSVDNFIHTDSDDNNNNDTVLSSMDADLDDSTFLDRASFLSTQNGAKRRRYSQLSTSSMFDVDDDDEIETQSIPKVSNQRPSFTISSTQLSSTILPTTTSITTENISSTLSTIQDG